MLETNKIYNLNCLDGLDQLDDQSVDLVVTSPPYDYMRQYSGAISAWNWDVFCQTVEKLYRVMKGGGVVVWVIGDQTKNGSETGTSFKQALHFMEVGFNLNDTMIWCLSGGTNLYVKTQKTVGPMPIKDIVRLDPSTVQLWDGFKWVNVLGWKQNKNVSKKVRLQLRSGENIYCTNEHRWVLSNGKEVLTSELKVGDVLKMCDLPDCEEHKPMILTSDILWLLGLYIAEGSHSDDTIQLSLCSDELKWVDRIKSAIESVGGTVTYTLNNNKLDVRCYSKIFNAIISQYVGGKTSKNKHLKPLCWSLPNNFLKEIVNGYLDGDGSYDVNNDRWRLGFTENQYLERDLRVLAGRLGAKLCLLRKGARIKSLNKTYPSLKGSWKWKNNSHYNEKNYSEILSITEEKIRIDEHMWDIEVDSDEHLFALSSGIITHNCKTNPMPQVKQSRYNQEFEYMFVFSKGKPKTFNPIMVPTKCGGQMYDSTCKNIDGESGRTHKTFKINSEKVHGNVFDIAIAQNKTAHPAVFSEEIARIHIQSWSNEGDLVLDPFVGSGTTAKVARDMKRRYIGFDVLEEYCKIANERLA